MLTISELAQHIRDSIPRARDELAQVARTHAELGAQVARGYIGHLQPSLTITEPLPEHVPAWEPLAPSTVEDKAALGFGPPDYEPLRRSGILEQSIEGAAVGLTGAIASTDEKMVYHELGTATMPARPVLARALIETLPALSLAMAVVALDALRPRRR